MWFSRPKSNYVRGNNNRDSLGLQEEIQIPHYLSHLS